MTNRPSLHEQIFGTPAPPQIVWAVNRELDIRDRIQSLIDARGLTRTNVAEKLGVQKSVVSDWLNGKRKVSMKTLARFEQIFEVKLWDVVPTPAVDPEQAPQEDAKAHA